MSSQIFFIHARQTPFTSTLVIEVDFILSFSKKQLSYFHVVSFFMILSLYHLLSCYAPLWAWLLKARTLRPLIVQDQVTSWVTFWSPSPLWLLASECSCGESWHSSPVGQDTISLHCRECNAICSDWRTDNNNLHEKQETDDLFLFFF